MSRSGYTDDTDDQWGLIRWRGAVQSAIRGARGQTMLRELIDALDAMGDKRLYPGSFATADGEFCTLGVLGARRGLRMDDLGDEEDCDPEDVGARFGIAKAMAAEIMWLNDEGHAAGGRFVRHELCGPLWRTDARVRHEWVYDIDDHATRRWHAMRAWAVSHLTAPAEQEARKP
jgi:hypothetical protein